ncbi:hypothetical protein PU560_01510 [Georgenia sp. 10Sc9-8]|uniref:Helix-turn-helix domain-containing protein n=1 Tax=Georgenia halotolerans TaxID=3028317 RepID=A0ABT5TSV0_9MICO|nr:hypothetical protein [Georgenia halotolerans]
MTHKDQASQAPRPHPSRENQPDAALATAPSASPWINPDPILDVHDWSAYSGLPVRKVRQLIDAQDVAVVRVGRRVYLRQSEADRFLDECTVPVRQTARRSGRR